MIRPIVKYGEAPLHRRAEAIYNVTGRDGLTSQVALFFERRGRDFAVLDLAR